MIAKTAPILMLCFASGFIFPLDAKDLKHDATCSKIKTGTKCDLTKTGAVKLTINSDDLHSKRIPFVLNNTISGTLHLHHTHLYDDHTYKDVIRSEFSFNNMSNKQGNVKYQLSFKDKKGLVAKSNSEISVPKGRSERLHSSNIPLSIKDIRNINSYEIKFTTTQG